MKNAKNKIIAGIAIASVPLSPLSAYNVYATATAVFIEVDETQPGCFGSRNEAVFRIEQGDTSFDLKSAVIARDENGNDLKDKLEIVKGEVDVNTLGEYKVEYSLKEGDASTTRAITYYVVKPNKGPYFSDVDNYRKIEEGSYVELDISKLESLKTGKNGRAVAVLGRDTDYSDATHLVEREGDVDSNTPGIYHVTYRVKDNWGKKAELVVTYEVIPKTPEAPKIHTIKFIANGKEIKSLRVQDGKSTGEPGPDADRAGYKFKGWFDSENPKEEYSKDIVYLSDKTFVADYEKIPDKIGLEFISDGKRISGFEQEYGKPAGVPVGEPDNIPKGKRFVGWKVDGGTEYYDPKISYTKDTKFIAEFAPQRTEYFLTFVIDGQKDQTVKVPWDEGIGEPPAVVKEGKIFVKWVDENDNELNRDFAYNEDKVFKAVLRDAPKPVMHRIVFVYGNGEKDRTFDVLDGDAVGENLGTPKQDGHIFMGWFIEKTGEKYTKDFVPKADTRVLAVWKKIPVPKKIEIKFFALNGKSSDDQTFTINENTELTESVTQPAREGYKFKGWFTSKGIEYSKFMKFSENATFFAEWEEIKKEEDKKPDDKKPENPDKPKKPDLFNPEVKPDPSKPSKPDVEKEKEKEREKEKKAAEERKEKERKETEERERRKEEERREEQKRKERKEAEEKREEERRREDAKPKIEVQNHTVKNIVGYETPIIGSDGLFYGSAIVNGVANRLTYDNLSTYGLYLSTPSGVQINGNKATFTKAGTYDFVISTPAGRTTSRVIIQENAAQEKDIKAATDKIEVFAGQSFNPLSFVKAMNGATKSEIKVEYIDQASGKAVTFNPGNVPFGKYTVKYSLANGKTTTLELVAITPPKNTEGGKPTILVRDKILVEQGKQVNLKEFAQAVDINGKSITSSITVSGDVKWDTVGTYNVVYSVTDSNGKKAEKKVVVHVLEKTKYQAEISKEKGSGIKIKTADDSNQNNQGPAQGILLASAATGILTLLIIKNKKGVNL